MTDKLRAAAQAALETLDILSKLGNGDVDGNSKGNEIAQDARQNLRAALAEPAIKESLTGAVQEPMHPEMKKMYEDYFDKCFRESSAQQRQWVGLTAEDINQFETWFDEEEECKGWVDPALIAKYFEAKLKEKNGEHI